VLDLIRIQRELHRAGSFHLMLAYYARDIVRRVAEESLAVERTFYADKYDSFELGARVQGRILLMWDCGAPCTLYGVFVPQNARHHSGNVLEIGRGHKWERVADSEEEKVWQEMDQMVWSSRKDHPAFGCVHEYHEQEQSYRREAG
jgi:hypothetical protein